MTDLLHVVTGGPDSGTSTLIGASAAAGIAISAEVGRCIIHEHAEGMAFVRRHLEDTP